MLQKLEINGPAKTVDASLRKYVNKKIGNTDRYLPRNCRESAHAEVHLKEAPKKDNSHCICEVTLRLPKQTIVIKEQALNMYAAVDIVEAKLKQQIGRYKDMHGSGKMHRRLFAKFRRQNAAGLIEQA
jgi:ribosomal subunit interface protein